MYVRVKGKFFKKKVLVAGLLLRGGFNRIRVSVSGTCALVFGLFFFRVLKMAEIKYTQMSQRKNNNSRGTGAMWNPDLTNCAFNHPGEEV